jgi:hypothetical protein
MARACRVLVAGATVFTLAAGQTAACAQDPNAAPTAEGEGEREVVFSTRYEDKGEDCTVRFTMTYPADTPPHSRMVRTAKDSNSYAGSDEAIQIPPQGFPAFFKSNDDGTVTFDGVMSATAYPCAPPHTSMSLAIGPCVSGDCLPARFEPGPEAERLGLREVDY